MQEYPSVDACPSIDENSSSHVRQSMHARRRVPGRSPARSHLARVALLACLLSACAHDVIPLDTDPVPTLVPPSRPLGITPGLELASFEVKRLAEEPFAERFTRALKDSQLFVGVIYPIPDDYDPLWKVRLQVRDELYDPNSNFWKSALANAFLPFRFVLYQQEDYTLVLEASITRKDDVIGTYSAKASVRHRFQTYDLNKELQAAELLINRASAEVLAAIANDLKRIDQEDRARAGR